MVKSLYKKEVKMNERIKKIREYLEEEEYDCILLTSPFDILYLLNINQSFNYIELNIVLLVTQKKLFFILTPINLWMVKQFLPDEIEIIESETEPYINNRFRYIKEIRDIIEKENMGSIALPDIQYIDVSEKCIRVQNPVHTIAAIKDKEEIKLIKKSAEILTKAFQKVMEAMEKNITELELRNIADIELHKAGSEKRAFPTKVAFGKKTSNVFPVSTMNKLNDDDIVMIDMGGMYRGYTAEMARTIYYGNSDAKKDEIYNIVISAYNKLRDFLKPGVIASSVDGIVRDHFKEMKHEQFFFHPLGESTGLVKGGITLAPGSQDVIKPGMVFVVEPALYIPDWGGVKIKETILITEEGIEELTGGPEPNNE
jgi:Xaa-Pro dipeptidase